MLFLLFEIGDERYALDAGAVVEVLPFVSVTRIPHAPAEVAGVFNHHGRPVPVIDMRALTVGQPARRRFSTRIILVHYPGEDGEQHVLGLIAEKVTDTMRREVTDFAASGIANERAPYLGSVAPAPGGLVQQINVGKLLPASTQKVLFTTAPACP